MIWDLFPHIFKSAGRLAHMHAAPATTSLASSSVSWISRTEADRRMNDVIVAKGRHQKLDNCIARYQYTVVEYGSWSDNQSLLYSSLRSKL